MPATATGCARVLRDCKRLGLHVEIHDGNPVLCGPKDRAGATLLVRLRLYRDEIVAALTPPPLPAAIEWLLPTGCVVCRLLDRPPDAPESHGRAATLACIPYGALLWRAPGGFWQLLKTLPPAWGLAVLKRKRRKRVRGLAGEVMAEEPGPEEGES